MSYDKSPYTNRKEQDKSSDLGQQPLSEGPTYHILPESPVNNNYCFVIPTLLYDKVSK